MNKDFINFLDNLKINKGDILYIASDITRILLHHKRKEEKFNANDLIDYFLERVGSKGSLLFPTFNWGFCKGETFDYNKTPSETGSLSKIALLREDFLRTKHPIYSFVVKGKDQNYLYKLDDESGWGPKSLFAYFYENNAKNLFIGIDYKNGFTFDHYFEEKIGVDYRYFKYFEAKYINRQGKEQTKKYKMYVRDLEKNIITSISDNMDLALNKMNAYTKLFYNDIYFGLVDMKIAGDIMEEDIRKQGGLIFAKKI